MRTKGPHHPTIRMSPIGKRPTSLEALKVLVLMALLVVMVTMMIEDPMINMVIVRDLHPLAIVIVEGEDTMMIENLILGALSVRGLHQMNILTREVDMSIAQEAQEHLHDLIGMMDAGNGKIHLVEIIVIIVLAPGDNIQHDLLCSLLHPRMHAWYLLG